MTSQLTAPELQAALARKEAPVVIDVREPAKYSHRHIPGAEHMPLSDLVNSIKRRHPNRDEEVVVYSDHGILSQYAATLLRSIGYRNVTDLAGGIIGFGEAA